MSTEEAAVGQEDVTSKDIGQIPAVIRVREVPAAAEAREQLLQAIAAEALALSGKHAGEASPALEQLARAYALVTAGGTAVSTSNEAVTVPIQTRAGGHQVGLCLELEP